MTSGIYIFKHLESGKQYVGQSIDINKRIKQHLRDVKRRKYRCPKFYRALKKYGPEGFEIRRIEFKPEMLAYLKDNLDLVEKALIELYGTAGDKGYNLQNGGSNGLHSDESKRKISKAAKSSEKAREHLARLNSDPEYQQKNREHLARLHSDPEFQQKRAEHLARLNSDPEYQQKNREHLARLNADPEYQQKRAERLSRLHSDPEYQQKRADHLARLHASPEHKEQLSRLHQSQRKLSPFQVQQVFQMRSEGLSQQKIADHFSVSKQTIGNILRGESYRDLQQTGETK